MKKLFTLSALTLALAACGGGGGGSDTTTKTVVDNSQPDNTQVDSGLCTSNLTLNGVDLNVSDYDTNGDGCLNSEELEAAQEAARQAKIVTVSSNAEGNNPFDEDTLISSLTLYGSKAAFEEQGKKIAVIEPNKAFNIETEFDALKTKSSRPDPDDSNLTITDGYLLVLSEYSYTELMADELKKLKETHFYAFTFKAFDPTRNIFLDKCTYSDGSTDNGIPANYLNCADTKYPIQLSSAAASPSAKLYLTIIATRTKTDSNNDITETGLFNAMEIPVRIQR